MSTRTLWMLTLAKCLIKNYIKKQYNSQFVKGCYPMLCPALPAFCHDRQVKESGKKKLNVNFCTQGHFGCVNTYGIHFGKSVSLFFSGILEDQSQLIYR